MPEENDENQKFDNPQNSEDNTNTSDVDDVVFEEDEEEKNPRDTIKKLRERLKKTEKEKQEYLELAQRIKADMVNAKRQDDEWRKEFVKFSEEKLLTRLLPVLESFNLATANRKAWEALPQDWRVGMEYIHKELIAAVGEHGLIEINPKIGDAFDPVLHEAVGTVEVLDKALDHTVAEVLQKGYKLGEKVLKPARVSVGEFKIR